MLNSVLTLNYTAQVQYNISKKKLISCLNLLKTFRVSSIYRSVFAGI